MILYKNNPDLPLRTCTTITGDKEYCKNCFRKNKAWHPKGVDLIEINGAFYMPDSPKIAFDNELKVYFAKDKNKYNSDIIMNGVIGYDVKNQQFILGAFTKNPYNNVSVVTPDNRYLAISAEVLEGSGYVEEIATGEYKKGLRGNVIKNAVDHRNKGYNIEDQNYEKLKNLYNKKPYKFEINHAKIANLLSGTTFGIELEACAGNLPNHLLARTGVCICKDGSLLDNGVYPPEYVTVPLSGAKGVGNTIELCEYLSTRNIIDLRCSYHAHLGGFNTSRQFLVALHSLCYKIQGGVFKMFPHYKLKPEGIKGKNYCKLLPKIFKQYDTSQNYSDYINSNYIELYKYLSEAGSDGASKGKRFEPSKEFNRKNRKHNGHYKWNRLARYHWMNMINSVFSKRNTIEFRLHTPTFNATKIINWLLICNAICKYAERYPLQCIDGTKIKFNDVLEYYQKINSNSVYHKFVSDYLKAYVAERTEMFKADKLKGDMTSNHELAKDKTYTFIYDERKLF